MPFPSENSLLPMQSAIKSKEEVEAEPMLCLYCRCGVQAAAVSSGDCVAIVGAGPIGLAKIRSDSYQG